METITKKDNDGITLYQRPMSISPWAGEQESRNGSVWISMKPKRIIDQYSKGSGTYHTSKPPVEFKFLAPLALNENIVHHWQAYESVASRIAQKARSFVKLGSEKRAFESVGASYLKEAAKDTEVSAQKGKNKISTIEDFATNLLNKVPESRIPRIKIDTPLYYNNSDRRQIVLEFHLFNEAKKNDKSPEKYLLKPIHELMKYSSPNLINKGGSKIEFPYMWELKTVPIDFINYPTCALTGVQPTWNSPYINGYPSSCNLQLTFIDLSPLYAGTITDGTVINVKSEKPEHDEFTYSSVLNDFVKTTKKITKKITSRDNPDKSK